MPKTGTSRIWPLIIGCSLLISLITLVIPTPDFMTEGGALNRDHHYGLPLGGRVQPTEEIENTDCGEPFSSTICEFTLHEKNNLKDAQFDGFAIATNAIFWIIIGFWVNLLINVLKGKYAHTRH